MNQPDSANGEHGVTRSKVTVVTLAYDHESCLVSIGVKDSPVGLVQMIVDEARRMLDIQRRQAAAFELQAQIAQAHRDAAIADAVRRRG